MSVFRRGCVLGMLVLAIAGCGSTSHPASGGLSLGCSKHVTAGKVVPAARSLTVPVSAGKPSAVVGTADGRWMFASLWTGRGGAVAVFALRHGAPRPTRTVMLPDSMPAASGMVLTHDGRWLLVAGQTATAVLDPAVLVSGRGDPVLGVLADSGSGQFEVAVSGDDRYVFVGDEDTGGLSVFDLGVAVRHGFTAPGVAVGIVPLDKFPVGVGVSPDGSRIYATTDGSVGPHGTLWLIDTARAEHGAGRGAVLARADAGCDPLRVAVSPDGKLAWVTAAASNAVLAFDTTELRQDPSRALRAVVHVGSEPTGLILVDAGRIALAGDSNRDSSSTGAGTTPQAVNVIDTAAALAHRPALTGVVPAGLFPRDLGYDSATGQVLLANYDSDDIELFTVPANR
jgi:DNA-binding beta-propeller fold protein YncE